MILKILAFAFLIPGALTTFLAKYIVKKYKLDEKIVNKFEPEPDDEYNYKFNKALIIVKMIGLVIAILGFIFVIIAFK